MALRGYHLSARRRRSIPRTISEDTLPEDELSKEVLKSNFRQYGQMEKPSGEDGNQIEDEKREYQRRDSQKREDAGAPKGRKSCEALCFPMFCGSGASKWLAKAAAAEPSGKMRDEKLHAVVTRSTF